MSENIQKTEGQTGKVPSWLDWIRKNIINPDTRLTSVEIIYSVYAMLMLLNHVYAIMYFPTYYSSAFLTPIAWCIFGIISIIMGRMWKDKGFLILIAFAIIKIIRSGIVDTGYITVEGCVVLYVFGGCYGVSRVIKKENRKTFLLFFCALWTTAMIVYSALCIHVAWTGEPIYNFVNESIRIEQIDKSMYMIFHPVQAGILASISIATAIIGFSITAKKILKGFFLIGIIIIFILGVLTTKRVNQILNSIIFSTAICIAWSQKFKKPVTWKKTGILLFAGAALFFLFLMIQIPAINVFNTLHAKGGILVSNALAESGETLTPRGFDLNNGMDGFLNGRVGIWTSVLQSFEKKPVTLLWGNSINQPMETVNAIREAQGLDYCSHAHNTWMQILLETGIPATLLYIGFTILLLKNAIELICNRDCLLWQRLIPVPAICCLIADLIDITCYADTAHPHVTLLYLFAGFTMVINQENQKNKKKDAGTS